jgi:cytochrome c oxidase subunit III
MTPSHSLDVSQLPDHTISRDSLLWWGQALMALIEASMFLMLIGIYFYLRLRVDIWPPPGTQLPALWKPTVELLPLLLSCYGSYLASEGAKKNSRRTMLIGMIVNVILAGISLGLRFSEWRSFNFDWRTDVHGSIVWSILFLHTFDAIADVLLTCVLIVIIARGRYGNKERIGVHVDSVLWYFIVGIWIPLYVVVYWGPHIVGAP